jgi:hypothetical protein
VAASADTTAAMDSASLNAGMMTDVEEDSATMWAPACGGRR